MAYSWKCRIGIVGKCLFLYNVIFWGEGDFFFFLTLFQKECFSLTAFLYCLCAVFQSCVATAPLMSTQVWGLTARGIVEDLLGLGHLSYLFVLVTIIQQPQSHPMNFSLCVSGFFLDRVLLLLYLYKPGSHTCREWDFFFPYLWFWFAVILLSSSAL